MPRSSSGRSSRASRWCFSPKAATRRRSTQISIDYAYPGPARLTGALERTIPAGTDAIPLDGLSIDRDGRFALRADAINADGAASFIFDVEATGSIQILDVIQGDDGCVQVQ